MERRREEKDVNDGYRILGLSVESEMLFRKKKEEELIVIINVVVVE